MALYENEQPSKDEAIEFVKLVDSNRVKSNALAEGYIFDHDEKLREQITSHGVYEWAKHKGGYLRVIRYLKDEGLTGEYPPRIEIEIVYRIARILHMHHIYKEHPERIKRTTGETATRALKHVDSLREMMKSDLQMEDIKDYLNLALMLDKLHRELTGEDATTYMKSFKGDVVGRQIVKLMYYLIDELLGETPGYAICELVSIIHPVEQQTVDRHIIKLSEKP